MSKKQEQRKWSKERWKVFFEKDLPIGITIACIMAFCVVMCIDDDSKPAPSTGAVHSYYREERSVEKETIPVPARRRVTPVQSKENTLIEKLSKTDFYEESDYYDGLDGEFNDIDYNEVVDYFAD